MAHSCPEPLTHARRPAPLSDRIKQLKADALNDIARAALEAAGRLCPTCGSRLCRDCSIPLLPGESERCWRCAERSSEERSR
jgi:hypothetical protein